MARPRKTTENKKTYRLIVRLNPEETSHLFFTTEIMPTHSGVSSIPERMFFQCASSLTRKCPEDMGLVKRG